MSSFFDWTIMKKTIVDISKNIWNMLNIFSKKETDVYFISGMCYNCSVFDKIELPKGCNKHYIEWIVPSLDESLTEYALRMSKEIKSKNKIILVGYSFGGILVQEIAKFMEVNKVILISTMKDEQEIPHIFQVAKKVNFADNLPMKLYSTSDLMMNLFNKYIYNLPTTALGDFMTVKDPVYIRWALRQITHWVPTVKLFNVYHIHGTKDQVFPYEQIVNPITIKGGDHLMIVKRSGQINKILNDLITNGYIEKKLTA